MDSVYNASLLLLIFNGICQRGFCDFTMLKDPKPWQDAVDDCQANGYKLITIKDQSKQTEVMAYISTTARSFDGYWIGLKFDGGSTETDEHFCWNIDNTCLSSWSNWRNNSSEPDHLNDNLQQHCIFLDKTMNFQWSSKQCSFQKGVICESNGPTQKFKMIASYPPSNSLFQCMDEEFKLENVLSMSMTQSRIKCVLNCHENSECNACMFNRLNSPSCILYRQ